MVESEKHAKTVPGSGAEMAGRTRPGLGPVMVNLKNAFSAATTRYIYRTYARMNIYAAQMLEAYRHTWRMANGSQGM